MWYRNAIFYSLDVKVFYDSNGDGIGDLQGVIQKLNYINSIGYGCIWLLPFYPSPKLDNGYDVKDYFNVDPLLGSLDDFSQLIDEASKRGIRIIIDLVINHTSVEHPWFLDAQNSRDSKYRHFYIWDDDPKSDETSIRTRDVREIWEYSEKTNSYYLHEYFKHQADLNLANPEVVSEVIKIMEFWLELGVSGFRIDAAHAVTNPVDVEHIDFGNLHTLFEKMNDLLKEKYPDAILLGEADVPPDELPAYFLSSDGRPRLHMLFNFISNKHTFLAFARNSGITLTKMLGLYHGIEKASYWLNFGRHHDELNLELLSESERKEVLSTFAPDENMRVFSHGIRRRLPPMLNNEIKRMKLFYAVIFGLPGAPLVYYGEEIGMGDDLDLEERNSVRTPMQWSDETNAGFSTCSYEKLYRPVISEGEFSYRKVNVLDQQNHPDSFLSFFCHLIKIRKQNSIISKGNLDVMQPDSEKVAAWSFKYKETLLMAVYNLSSDKIKTSFTTDIIPFRMIPILEDEQYGDEVDLSEFNLNPYGFRWVQIFTKN
ncbi:alpha-amylase family protein [Nitrosomonas sp. Nm166]|uniref:alpha-amylase family protein n=1 Tax=Nitrosomonas sp. Nm166 TaxID=1881054 RepID=UPI0008E6AFDB|nr:alpha-amylase family protein [Nitrosomonas sp. Nm166]SFD97530.1 maltose alpha-D-glucosyltransferase/ alpha-amylase [Nitrosomonas sp. Nm166]